VIRRGLTGMRPASRPACKDKHPLALASRARVWAATITAMPSTISAHGLERSSCVRWGQPLREPQTGV
jgi:hypothetical protein